MSSYTPKPYSPHFFAAPDAAATYSIDNPWQANRRIALRRQDAQPLTRGDIQYDLLEFIFSDSRAVFTPMFNQSASKQTFRELYMCAIKGSNKCSKVLKEKMIETPAFALELAKFSLLTNVGRINTTMAFFPEMKTTLRSYHPVPSLQKTTGNVQDAPRIKSCLKASLLPSESVSTVPNTPDEVMALRAAGKFPPTSIVNLIFVLSNHPGPLSPIHFDGRFNFLDLFLPKYYSSRDRALAFLWHIFHYHEPAGAVNPFDDDFARQNPGKAPLVRQISDAEMARENVDTRAEIEWGRKMSSERVAFLRKLVTSQPADAVERKSKDPAKSAGDSRRLGKRCQEDSGPFMYYVPAPLNSRPDPAEAISRSHPRQQFQPSHGSKQYRPEERRSIIEQTFQMILHSDPLLDSDEENADEHLHRDYSRRLDVITRIRGRPPTPQEVDEPTEVTKKQSMRNPRSTFTRYWQPLTP